jgi:hypothetical protein
MPQISTAIRPGVYFAAVQDEGVIMDLVRDRYYGLGTESAALWNALQQGVSPEHLAGLVSGRSPERARALVARQLQAWREARLLASDAEIAADVPRLKALAAPAVAGLDADRVAAARFSWRLLSRLMHGHWWCRRALERRGICATLKRIQDIPVTGDGTRSREDVLYRMVHVYYAFRRLSKQGKDDCVPRSLAMAFGLRSLGIDAEICFGVQKFPFAAHAWLEAGGRVVNDSPATVAKFSMLARF